MKFLLKTLGFFTLLSTSHAAYTEASVSIQIKLHQQEPPRGNNNFSTATYKTFTLKTADVIQILKQEIHDENYQWTRKARLIYVDDQSGHKLSGYVIRQKGMEDYYLGNQISFINITHVSERNPFVFKSKSNLNTGDGTYVGLGVVGFMFRPDNSIKKLEISGTRHSTLRYATDKSRKELFTIFTMDLTGVGDFELTDWLGDKSSIKPFFGVAEGSFKISSPKILMHAKRAPAGS